MEVYVVVVWSLEQDADVVGVFRRQEDAVRAMEAHETPDDCFVVVDILQ